MDEIEVRGRWTVAAVGLLLSLGWLGDSPSAALAEPSQGADPAHLSAAPSSGRQGPRKLRVLFVGNSYTRYNLLPVIVRRVARSAGVVMGTDAVARGGLTLRMHWRRREAAERIRHGRFSHVVLQGHSTDPVDRPQEFSAYADRFNSAIQRTGAATVLYETWAPRDGTPFYRQHPLLSSPHQMLEQVGRAYGRLASRLGAAMAPVGRAFAAASHTDPDIQLYRADGAHPSWDGTYLAACVLFGTITGRSPLSIEYAPWEVDSLRAARLRQLATRALFSPGPDQRR